MSRRKLLAAALPLIALLVLAVACPRRPAEPKTPAELAARLRSRGLAHEGREVGPGHPRLEAGLYLRRPGAGPWDALTVQPRFWRGCVRVTVPLEGSTYPEESPSCRRMGPLLLVGDAAELDAIFAALR